MAATFWVGVLTDRNKMVKIPVKEVYFFLKKKMDSLPELVVYREADLFIAEAKSDKAIWLDGVDE